MKKNIYFLLGIVLSLILFGCTNVNDTNSGTKSVALTVTSIIDNNIIVNAVPSDDITLYTVYPITQSEYENEYQSNDALVAQEVLSLIKDDLSSSSNGITTFSGMSKISMKNIRDIYPDTSYLIFSFGIGENGEIVGDIFSVEQTTMNLDGIGLIAISGVTYDDANVEVDSNNWDGRYYVAPLLKSLVDGDFGGDISSLVKAMLVRELELGTDFTKVDNRYIFEGDINFKLSSTAWIILPDSEYYVIAVGVDDNGNITSTIRESKLFVTDPAPDISVNISFDEITDNSVKVTYTPSDDNVNYFISIVETEVVKGKSDKEIMDNFINYYGQSIPLYIAQGRLEVPIAELKSGTEYMLVSCGFVLGHGPTSELYSETFTTTGKACLVLNIPTKITIPDVDFGELAILKADAYSSEFSVIRKDKNMRYFPMTVTAKEYNAIKTDEERIINDFIFYKNYGFTILTSFADILGVVTSDFDTPQSVFADLEPLTDYVFYAYGVDIETVQPLTRITKVTFRTGDPADEKQYSYMKGNQYQRHNIQLMTKPSSLNMVVNQQENGSIRRSYVNRK